MVMIVRQSGFVCVDFLKVACFRRLASLQGYSKHPTLLSRRSGVQKRRLATGIETAFENSLRRQAGIGQPANDIDHQELSSNASSSNGPVEDDVVGSYLVHKHVQRTTGGYGSQITPHYQPYTLLTDPPSPRDITLELLLASQAHLGHSTSLWNPANARYIFGIREGIHIISLDVTAAHLRRAAKVVSGVCERGGLVLFVGTRTGQDRCVVKAAQMARACHLFERWTPGSITNGQQILGRCRMTVVDEFDRPVNGFADQLIDRSVLKPDLVVCLNPLENYVLLHECALANIPTIGIIDTDADPTWVTYPIPANDDSIRCVQVIAGVLGRAGEEGQAKRQMAAQRGRLTFVPAQGLTVPDEQDHEDVEAFASLGDRVERNPGKSEPQSASQFENQFETGIGDEVPEATMEDRNDSGNYQQMGRNLPQPSEASNDAHGGSVRESNEEVEDLHQGQPGFGKPM